MKEVKLFFEQDSVRGKLSITEFKEFWDSCSEQEKTLFRDQAKAQLVAA